MNQFKKVALGLAVAGLAVGFSAFKTAEKKTDALANTYYVLVSNAQYQKVSGSNKPSLDKCQETSSHACVISYSVDPGQDNLDPNNLPSTPNYQSTERGIWQP